MGLSQGVALGWYVTPLWGSRQPRAQAQRDPGPAVPTGDGAEPLTSYLTDLVSRIWDHRPGSSTRNSAPGSRFTTSTRPPMASVKRSTSASPMPVPGMARAPASAPR